MVKQCRSTQQLDEHQLAGGGGGGVPVKFDIWEEADQEQGASIGPGDYALQRFWKNSESRNTIINNIVVMGIIVLRW